jgi:glucokinase
MTGCVDADGTLRQVSRVEPAPVDVEGILQAVTEQYEAILKKEDCVPARCGMAIPGLTDPLRGVWWHGSFSGIRDCPIRDVVEERLGIPVYMANDVNACALAERLWGGAKAEPDYLWVTLSNGVGGAIMLDGRLYHGPGCAAGEVGHMKAVRDGGLPCDCGASGCLEEYASGRAISRHYKDLNKGKELLPAKAIAGLARDGDAAAMEVFQSAARHLGNVLADAISLLNVPCIFLGGGVAQSFDLMEEVLLEALGNNLYPEANKVPRVAMTHLGYEAALLGAAATAHPHVQKHFL